MYKVLLSLLFSVLFITSNAQITSIDKGSSFSLDPNYQVREYGFYNNQHYYIVGEGKKGIYQIFDANLTLVLSKEIELPKSCSLWFDQNQLYIIEEKHNALYLSLIDSLGNKTHNKILLLEDELLKNYNVYSNYAKGELVVYYSTNDYNLNAATFDSKFKKIKTFNVYGLNVDGKIRERITSFTPSGHVINLYSIKPDYLLLCHYNSVTNQTNQIKIDSSYIPRFGRVSDTTITLLLLNSKSRNYDLGYGKAFFNKLIIKEYDLRTGLVKEISNSYLPDKFPFHSMMISKDRSDKENIQNIRINGRIINSKEVAESPLRSLTNARIGAVYFNSAGLLDYIILQGFHTYNVTVTSSNGSSSLQTEYEYLDTYILKYSENKLVWIKDVKNGKKAADGYFTEPKFICYKTDGLYVMLEVKDTTVPKEEKEKFGSYVPVLYHFDSTGVISKIDAATIDVDRDYKSWDWRQSNDNILFYGLKKDNKESVHLLRINLK